MTMPHTLILAAALLLPLTTLRGDDIAAEFRALVDEYVQSHYAPRNAA